MSRTIQADASELVQGLLSPAPSEAFSIFRPQENGDVKEFPVRVRLLRAEENVAALKAAQEYARKMGEVSKEYGDIYREAQAYEVVARSVCHPKPKERQDGTSAYIPLFVDASQVRESFTENEVAAVLNCYEVTKAKFSCLNSFDPEDIDAWATRLSDELLGEFFLGQLDSGAWPTLLLAWAREVRRLRELAGQPLPTLQSLLVSDPETSESGTTGSTSPAAVQSSDGVHVDSGEMLTREKARELVKKNKAKKKK